MFLASTLTTNLAILVLAGFIGFVVISKVPNTLHTPLMSGTNAIHGIVLLGGLLVIGLSGNGTFNKVILVIAIAFGTINIVGGFLVTDRMLEMFKSKPKPAASATPARATRRPGKGERRDRAAARDVLPAEPELPGRPLHHRLRAVHPGPARLSGPTTAVRGNRIAAVGMAIAVIATLLSPNEGNWGADRARHRARRGRRRARGAPGEDDGDAADGRAVQRRRRRRRVPDLLAEFRAHGHGYAGITPTYVAIFSVFAAIVGSVSFWGSNIAFGKLQEILPGRPITLGAAQQVVNGVLLVLAVAAGVDLVAGAHSELLFIGMLVCAALLGNAVVLPIGGADMPVVISMLNAFTGLSAAATGIALNNPALIVAGMIVGASGSILTNLMAIAMNRSIPAIIAGGFGGGGAVEGASGAGEHAGTVRSTTRRRRRDPARLRQPRDDRPRLRHGRRPGPARRARADQGARRAPGRGQLRDPPGRRAHARTHERAAGRGRRPV